MENKIKILNKSTNQYISINTKIAKNFWDRFLGLMFTKQMPDCDGLLIMYCNSIHTFFMRYNLDLVFLDSNLKVVKIIYEKKTWRATLFYFRATQVLEMKAGTLDKNIKVGNTLEFLCIN